MGADPTFAEAVAQRLAGYEAVARVRARELRARTEWEAAVIADDLLQLLPLLPPVERSSGLIDQQRLFAAVRS